jgi:lipoprotein-anchoring transpeptidase ErfK/SrfK
MTRAARAFMGLLVPAAILCASLSTAAAHTSQQPVSSRIGYHLEPVVAATIKKQFQPAQIGILEKLNRRDLEHLVRLKEIVVPDAWPEDELAYGVMPETWAWASERPKAIVVSQPAQVFGAYEFGKLVRWGPVSSGRKETPTPAGNYNLTWKTKSRVSTDNDQWLLKWYFNFINARGVSFHQFELPGFAASHACVRLLERDAIWLYGWGDQWKLSPDRLSVLQTGSTVVILGEYAHDKPGPWTSAEWWTQLPIKLPDA